MGKRHVVFVSVYMSPYRSMDRFSDGSIDDDGMDGRKDGVYVI